MCVCARVCVCAFVVPSSFCGGEGVVHLAQKIGLREQRFGVSSAPNLSIIPTQHPRIFEPTH